MKNFHPLLLLAFGLCTSAGASAPRDFRMGVELRPEPGHPLAELGLPDPVYQGLSRADLGDLGVFNAQGIPVPYAFCAAPVYEPASPPPGEQALPVFPLQTARPSGGGTRVEVTSRDGLSVAIKPDGEAPSAAPQGGTEIAAYVIDARATRFPLNGLRVRWRTPDGASELYVRIEDSEDLDQWRVLVPQTTLVQAGAAGQTLERERLPLPPGQRSYLRITRIDPGPAPILEEVLGSFAAAAPAHANPPLWITPARLAPPQPGQGYAFDAARLAPIEAARVELPAPNMNLQVALQSRSADEVAWRTVWSGPVYRVGDGADERRSEDAAFAADSERYWRIQVLRGAETLGAAQPGLVLGYRPVLLRFLAQGDAPFTLAYGSGRVSQTQASACDNLLQGLAQSDLQTLISHRVAIGEPKALGGEAAMQPPPKPAPLRRILLWALLLAGAAAVAWMASGLLRNLRRH